jgi:hypothetical protein
MQVPAMTTDPVPTPTYPTPTYPTPTDPAPTDPAPTPTPTSIPTTNPIPTPAPTLSAPGRVSKPAIRVKARKLTISWRVPRGPVVTGYLVRIKSGKTVSVAAPRHHLVLKNLKPGAYKISVAAVNAAGQSRPSLTVTARVRP